MPAERQDVMALFYNHQIGVRDVRGGGGRVFERDECFVGTVSYQRWRGDFRKR